MSDLISRKEAIKAVKFYETFYDPYPRVIEALEDLPSVQPRKGKWIKDRAGYIICSECNWFAPTIEVGCVANRHMEQHESDFCWHCGADMRGGQDESFSCL